jgi:hypothetical protein
MDRVCVLPPLSTDKREFTPFEQIQLVLRETYDGTFPLTDQIVTEANCEYQNLYVRSIKIDDGAVRALEWSCRRVRVGLVSNYPCGASLRRSLHSTGIADLLDPVVVSGDVGYIKPHPKLFEAALDAVGVPAGRVLFVGPRFLHPPPGGAARDRRYRVRLLTLRGLRRATPRSRGQCGSAGPRWSDPLDHRR